MKKTLITIALAIASISSFGQGYFLYGTTPRTAWDNFTTPGLSRGAATVNTAFLWGTTGTPLVDSIFSSTGTNVGAGFTSSTELSTAWTDILSDPNYQLAVNNGTGLPVIQLTTGTGGISYNSSQTFGVTGTAPGSYTVFVIGWSSVYATPAAAQAAGSPVGWSAPLSYACVNNIGTPSNFSVSGLQPFGVVAVVPEPATMALAGLGGLAMLMFRRRK